MALSPLEAAKDVLDRAENLLAAADGVADALVAEDTLSPKVWPHWTPTSTGRSPTLRW
ncbi:MAG TPA: hypothetical protein PK331_13050 [Gordonia sp. (in: high G+C Gram-positive bacteria)]|uniref:hypothetical protein n=1 Tax=Gordonia sp. (in: high G+C Gram-positive bacteria) TaxID=84139 RepID=UPI002CDBBADA|nr:hypothetical protein [Gordonia sp. (in: high G+C Gram-positive bacteria)]HNP55892.1 hypothetical protein [Gordonia sp. (in: high G+C Gram-positive bacteria)]HRC51833.1 hypothetical protein [Gordonia sp. (in: high G+C Gram-positive bacteria)]